MIGKEAVKAGCKTARPVFSLNHCEAHRRVMNLYKAYYRFIPYIVRRYDIPKTEQDCRKKIREYFYKNACVTDIRIIDILVLKGYINLKEMTENWQQKGHVMDHWHPTHQPRPCDFMGKFLANLE